MAGALWFCEDPLRRGFVMTFKNGYKVIVEFLKEERNVSEVHSVAERRELIEKISWTTILRFIDDLNLEEHGDTGVYFDVRVVNRKGGSVRLPSWGKHIDRKSGVDLVEVVDILHEVKSL
jgi:hypothetical protein